MRYQVNNIVMFNVKNLKESAVNNHVQTVRGQVLSIGKDRIEVNNFDRLSDKSARRDNEGRCRRQYRFDQIVGEIHVIYRDQS